MRYLLILLILTFLNLTAIAQDAMMKVANDIIGLTGDYNMAWESLDMDSVASYHSEDFTYYWHGSLSVSNNKDFVEEYKKIMSDAAEWTMYIDNLQVQVLDDNNAIIGFDISETSFVLKDGTEYDYGIGAMTYFWHRRDGEWKLVHIHESGLDKENEMDEEEIEQIAADMAHSWIEAWNGDIDLDHIMSLHHPDLQYYWHGEPMSYDGLRHVLLEYVIGKQTYNNKAINVVATAVDNNNAVVGFQSTDKSQPGEKAAAAYSLMITRSGSEWKIVHIHESEVK